MRRLLCPACLPGVRTRLNDAVKEWLAARSGKRKQRRPATAGLTVASLVRMRVFLRIDYQIATPGLAAKAPRCEVYKPRRFSEHAPLVIDYSGRL